MVLSADDLGIEENLSPLFCCGCGCRIGWLEDDCENVYCEDCAKTTAAHWENKKEV